MKRMEPTQVKVSVEIQKQSAAPRKMKFEFDEILRAMRLSY